MTQRHTDGWRSPAPVTPRAAEERYLTTEECAGYLSVASGTLRRWRRKNGEGPPCIRMGGRVRYRVSAVDEWMRAKETS